MWKNFHKGLCKIQFFDIWDEFVRSFSCYILIKWHLQLQESFTLKFFQAAVKYNSLNWCFAAALRKYPIRLVEISQKLHKPTIIKFFLIISSSGGKFHEHRYWQSSKFCSKFPSVLEPTISDCSCFVSPSSTGNSLLKSLRFGEGILFCSWQTCIGKMDI